jgi:hypothetical protein
MKESKAAADFLKKLTGDWLRLDEDACRVVSVSTQMRTPNGQPDIQITSSREMVIVEVKVDAPVRSGQIPNYRKILKDSPYDRDCTRLVLLTRFDSRLRPRDKRDKPDFAVHWYKVADWLSEADKGLKEKTSKYLCQQFREFMRGRGLTMDHVGKEFVPGIQAISSFMAMLEHALDELDIRKGKKTSWVNAVGCLFHIGRRSFCVRIYFSEPSKLQLTEFRGKWKWVRDGESLDLAKEGFFALPKEDQTEYLKSFIRKETAVGKRPRS